jgi:hypothetical protein
MTCSRSALVAAAGLALTGCMSDVNVPPVPPTLFPVTSPTGVPIQVLTGTKGRTTAILIDDEIRVPADSAEVWSTRVTLTPGENIFAIRAQSQAGLKSRPPVLAAIVFEPLCPAGPTVDTVATPTKNTTQTIGGEKPASTALELWTLDGAGDVVTKTEIEALGETTTWSYAITLSGEGPHPLALVARDADGRTSEPVGFAIVLDTTAPAITTRYPPIGADLVPTDAIVEVALDGDLAIDPSAPPQGILTLVNTSTSIAVGGGIAYNPLSHVLWLNAGGLPPSVNFRVTLVAAELTDTAGNRLAADASWTFTTGTSGGGAVPATPTAVWGSPSPTTEKVSWMSGVKDAWTSVWANGLEIVPITADTTWTAVWELAVGANELSLVSKGVNGATSAAGTTNISRELQQPAPPVLNPAPPASAAEASLVLGGTKPVDTAILADGVVVVCRTSDTIWGFTAPLVPGPNEIRLATRNADMVESEPVTVRVDYGQVYAGQVPGSYQLYVAFSLRDLTSVQPIGSSFETGANKYGIDVWLEGPLSSGESCRYDSSTFERQDARFLATLKHYKGTKQGHTDPFADADYRAPDFLAAMIASGALAASGFSPGMDRRDASGHQSSILSSALTPAVVDAIDDTCSARTTIAVDGCTEATVGAGLREVRWVPRTIDSKLIDQGEYVLQIALSLDRDPSWVAANDREVCWADDAFNDVGSHRIVRRLSLGASPYSIKLGRATEQSGPDPELGSVDGRLRYVDGDISIVWGPAQ